MSARPSWWSSDEWETPAEFVAKQAAEFGSFTLDPCCRRENAKASQFFTKEDDGLAQLWTGRVWLNPPYSAPAPWLRKAIASVARPGCALVVALLPARTETGWFHDLVIGGAAEIRFVRGRLRFLGWERTPIPAPRNPSLLAIYRGAA